MKEHNKLPLAAASLLQEHGYSYICYEEDEGLHYSQKPVKYSAKLSQEMLDAGWKPVTERRYAVVKFNNEDIDNGNLEFFLNRGYSRA
jgi:hypothetical protein